MKATAKFNYEIWNDGTKTKVAKGEFSIDYNTTWNFHILLNEARAKAQGLTELFWNGGTMVCHLNGENGFADIITYTEE